MVENFMEGDYLEAVIDGSIIPDWSNGNSL
jgi:hypothetical protein